MIYVNTRGWKSSAHGWKPSLNMGSGFENNNLCVYVCVRERGGAHECKEARKFSFKGNLPQNTTVQYLVQRSTFNITGT